MILLIETATQVCSVALSHQGRILCELHSDEPNAHSSRMATLIQDLMQRQQVRFADLQAVCVSSGPGSYTALRLGVSAAKGYCYALHIPLLAVPTLLSMAATAYALNPAYDGIVCPMIDARRMECYTALYGRPDPGDANPSPLCLRPVQADIIEPSTYDAFLSSGKVLFIGDGADKTRPLLATHPNARYADNFRISAAGMASIAEYRLAHAQTEDVAYFEPFYLKDFVAKKSIVRGLR